MLVICNNYKSCNKKWKERPEGVDPKQTHCKYRFSVNPEHWTVGGRWVEFEKKWRSDRDRKTIHCWGVVSPLRGRKHELMEYE